MKKQIIFILLLILFNSFILAQEMSEFGNESEVEEIQQDIDEYVPIDDDGEFDPSKYKSKAEERIEKINSWIEKNASWLKLIFGMVPEVSWLFAFTLFFWMLFFTNLVLNGNIFDIVLQGFLDKYKKIIGLCVFVIMLVPRVTIPYYLGLFSYKSWDIIWNWLIPMGTIAVIIGSVVMGAILIVVSIFFPGLTKKIKLWLEKKREKKAKEQTDEERKEIHIFTENMMKRTK